MSRATLPVRHLLISATLFGLAADGWSAEPVQGGDQREFGPGKAMGLGQGRTVVIRGLLDLDVVNQGQYTSGNRNVSDHRGAGLGRAELGAKIKPDETSAVVISMAWQSELGQTPDGTTNNSRDTGYAVMNEAYVDLRDVLGFESFGIKGGRMPVTWNLRPHHGAWLYDSTANHAIVTSWDGGQVSFTGIPGYQINPFIYAMPNSGTMFGAEANWTPPLAGSNRVYITGLASWEESAPYENVDPASSGSLLNFTLGAPYQKVATYNLGATVSFGQVEVFMEGAIQNGDRGDGVGLEGYGGYTGIEWKIPSPNLTLSGQYDHRSGDDNPGRTTGNTKAFVNPWESTRDLYIVEDEKYGELSRILSGDQNYGMKAFKLRGNWIMDARSQFGLDLAYGFFRTAASVQNIARTVTNSNDFGQEFDLTFSYLYNYNSKLSLLGGMFMPKEAYVATAPNPAASEDFIYLMAGNVTVTF